MEGWSFYTSDELKARGWLRRPACLAGGGAVRQSGQNLADVQRSAWIGGDREGWERVPYWLDGFVPLAYLLEDADMIARARRYIDAILRAQRPDGWICPCADEDRARYDTWAVLLISKVLTVYYDCSKDERVPEALYRLLKNYYTLLESGPDSGCTTGGNSVISRDLSPCGLSMRAAARIGCCVWPRC